MPILATLGIKNLYYAPVNSSDPRTMPATGYKKVDVYQDTCTFVDKDPTITEHKSETSSKKIIMKTKESADLTFSIMDPSHEERVAFCGGTDTSGTYSEPETAQNIELALVVEPQEGDFLCVSCASIAAKNNTTYSAKGITLLEVTANPEYAYKFTPTSPITTS